MQERARLERQLGLPLPEDLKQHHPSFQAFLQEMQGRLEEALSLQHEGSLPRQAEEGEGGQLAEPAQQHRKAAPLPPLPEQQRGGSEGRHGWAPPERSQDSDK